MSLVLPAKDRIVEGVGEFKVVNERRRTYVFPGGKLVHFDGVMAVCVRPSGTHRLELRDENNVVTLAIVAAGWLAIRIKTDEWTF